jgi:HD-GYP domain-containing protein (c-di-GMP phosphodiesterase class II)
MNQTAVQCLQEFIRHLAAAASTASLYPLEHRQVLHLCDTALTDLLAALEDREDLALLRVDDRLVLDGQPLKGGPYLGRLAQMLKYRGIGHLRLNRRIERGELLALIGGLAGRSEGKEFQSSPHLRLGRAELHRARGSAAREAHGEAQGGSATTPQAAPETAPEADVEAGPGQARKPPEHLARLMDLYDTARRHRQLHVVGINEIVSTFIDALAGTGESLLVLAPLRDMDEYTFTHSVNVCVLNLAQATALGIEGPMLHDIGIAAMLHDVGKLFIPDEILNKPGSLTEEEWQIVREHPLKGARFLLDTPGVPRMAVVTAFEHHMRFDQSGYPVVREAWSQNLCSQMTTISDLFDSMLTRRPYREPAELEEVSTTIRYAGGTQLHPILAENFLQLIKKFPEHPI